MNAGVSRVRWQGQGVTQGGGGVGQERLGDEKGAGEAKIQGGQ